MNRFALGALALAALVWAGCGQTCSPDTCNGCCDAAGTCQPGNQPSACGHLGDACDACTPGQTCNLLGQCTSPGGNGSGNGGVSGNGAGAGTSTGSSGTTGGTTGNTLGTTGGTTGSTTGGNSVSGGVSFAVQGALGEVEGNALTAWVLADAPLTCPMLYGDAGLSAQHAVVGLIFHTATGSYPLGTDAGALLEEGALNAAIQSDPYVATSGVMDFTEISASRIAGTYQASLEQDGGSFIQLSGRFDVPVCPMGP